MRNWPFLIIFCSPAMAQSTFTCTDNKGTMTYSLQPCAMLHLKTVAVPTYAAPLDADQQRIKVLQLQKMLRTGSVPLHANVVSANGQVVQKQLRPEDITPEVAATVNVPRQLLDSAIQQTAQKRQANGRLNGLASQ